jgi:hypothetical protein
LKRIKNKKKRPNFGGNLSFIISPFVEPSHVLSLRNLTPFMTKQEYWVLVLCFPYFARISLLSQVQAKILSFNHAPHRCRSLSLPLLPELTYLETTMERKVVIHVCNMYYVRA